MNVNYLCNFSGGDDDHDHNDRNDDGDDNEDDGDDDGDHDDDDDVIEVVDQITILMQLPDYHKKPNHPLSLNDDYDGQNINSNLA